MYQHLFTNYWPQCTHRIFAGMLAGGFVPQQASTLGIWTTVTDALVLDANGNNQLLIPASTNSKFYRLVTP